mgnify:CR=1 FL=1
MRVVWELGATLLPPPPEAVGGIGRRPELACFWMSHAFLPHVAPRAYNMWCRSILDLASYLAWLQAVRHRLPAVPVSLFACCLRENHR